MLFLILFAVLIVAGIIVAKKSYSFDWFGIILGAMGGICLGVCLILLAIKPIDVRGQIVNYEVMKQYIEQVNEQKTNKRGTDLINAADRVKLGIEITKEYNALIMRNKAFVDDPWIGIYYSRKIAELELLRLK